MQCLTLWSTLLVIVSSSHPTGELETFRAYFYYEVLMKRFMYIFLGGWRTELKNCTCDLILGPVTWRFYVGMLDACSLLTATAVGPKHATVGQLARSLPKLGISCHVVLPRG